MEIIDIRNDAPDVVYQKLAKRNNLERKDVLESVEQIIGNVRSRGDSALLEYTEIFDSVMLEPDRLRVSKKEIEDAYRKVDPELIEVIRRAKNNIEDFHCRQKGESWFLKKEDGIMLGQLYRALDVVGVYVPGGTAPLPSSVLMNVIPAKVAGVNKVIMTTPPARDGTVNAAILVAASEVGVDEVYRAGGAQAIAAMAFGTQTLPKVDKIVGPGNIYVAAAKKMVYGHCDIDMIAGPSEIVIVADEYANYKYVAADLLSQAEHDVLASSILITTCEKLAKEVQKEIQKQMQNLSRKEIMQKSIEDYGVIIITRDIQQALDMVNKIAPEHLELCIREPLNYLDSIKNAGAVFLGDYSPEPLGDYFAGPNHVLPTSGTARFFSPLNTGDFIKKSSVISYTREALHKVKDDVALFAQAEGLTAHANAVKVRFK